ncbi:MAG: methyltransferase domain-containing protein [Acidobacteriota bacterium]
MNDSEPPVRRGEYAQRGDYHRELDESWSFRPTYLAKMRAVRRYLDPLPPATRVLDAGCGEGVLVQEYAGRLAIQGVDLHYTSPLVRAGSLTALPFEPEQFDRVLCLDVLEHLSFADQRPAFDELFRVLAPDGELLLSVPNLAHLQSRVHFALKGRLIRTAALAKHPGDRPVGEFLELAAQAGFEVVWRRGIFPTVPVLTALIGRHPASLQWLHTLLSTTLPVAGWCFLNVVCARKPR